MSDFKSEQFQDDLWVFPLDLCQQTRRSNSEQDLQHNPTQWSGSAHSEGVSGGFTTPSTSQRAQDKYGANQSPPERSPGPVIEENPESPPGGANQPPQEDAAQSHPTIPISSETTSQKRGLSQRHKSSPTKRRRPKEYSGTELTQMINTLGTAQLLGNANTMYNTLYNELENTLHTEFTNKLHTHMYDRLHTELSERLHTEATDKPFAQILFHLYTEMYEKLSNEVLKKLSGELFMKISKELYSKVTYNIHTVLTYNLYAKLFKELFSYVSCQLYDELFGKLHTDLHSQLSNQLSNQMTDSADDHQQQQEQEQEQQQKTHENGSSTDTNVPPQPLQYVITSQNGQLDIPLLGDITKVHLQSYDATPFAFYIMLLGVLANNPNILLPLASLKKCFFDHIHRLNEESFREHHEPAGCNETVIKMVIGVTCTRLKYAIDCLYPPNKEEDPWKRVIPELEKAHAILEYIIRDSLSVYNPMKVLLSYLRSLTTRYHASSLSTPQEHETFVRDVVLGSDSWIYELKHVCSLYGLYLWDSQWMTNEEWDELAQHMRVFYAEICPYVQDDFAVAEGYGDKQLDNHRRRVNRYFKSILRCIASCFAFRYRPMKNPSLLNVPYGWEPDVIDVDCSWIEMEAYFHTLRVLPDVFKQCVMQYMTNPTTFHQPPLADSHLKEEYLLTTSDAKGHPSVHDYIMSKLDAASKGAFDGWVPEDALEDEDMDWTPKVVGFDRTDMTPHMALLIDCIVKHPPTVDPVYNRIKDVFPKKVNRSNIITMNDVTPLPGDPGFTYHESSSS